MTINSNITLNKLKIERYEDQSRDSSHIISKNALSSIYYKKIIKRFIYKSILGHWFPYIDVYSHSRQFQLSLYYGKTPMNFSNEKYCCNCNVILRKDFVKNRGFPIALCSDCMPKTFSGYYKCRNQIYNNLTKDFRNQSSDKDLIVCSDLLNPRCDFPPDSDKINPCLKNHCIGLIVKDLDTLILIFGQLDVIKYQMISIGGLFGVVLGYKDRILNFEFLEKLLYKIAPEISNHAQKLGIKVIFGHEFKENNNKNDFIINLLLTLSRYYNLYYFRKLGYEILRRPIAILQSIIKFLFDDFNFNIEIIAFYEIYKLNPPLNPKLREYIIKILLNVLEIKNYNISELSKSLFKKFGKNQFNFNSLYKLFNFFDFFNLDTLHDSFDIYEILNSYGKYSIVFSNISSNPLIISLDSLIGRTIC